MVQHTFTGSMREEINEWMAEWMKAIMEVLLAVLATSACQASADARIPAIRTQPMADRFHADPMATF